MDKETLSNYGWIVILVLILSVLLALATPFGSFVADAIKATTAGFFNVNGEALGVVGITIPEQDFDDPSSDENNTSVIPSGGTYYVGVGNTTTTDYTGYTAVYGPGDAFPETPNIGDIYVYEDYEYRYGIYWAPVTDLWGVNSQQAEGWAARVLSTEKSNYLKPLTIIGTEPVTNFSYTWQNCKALISAPEIPEYAMTMHWAFAQCSSLIDAPVIPLNVRSLDGTFNGCQQLEIAPIIPENVYTMESVFAGCMALKSYVGSADPEGDFSDYLMPATLKSLYNAFSTCKLMTVAPRIPEKVTDARGAFYGNPPNIIWLIGEIYMPCTLVGGKTTNMYYTGSEAELIIYCVSDCTGCSNCNSHCGH